MKGPSFARLSPKLPANAQWRRHERKPQHWATPACLCVNIPATLRLSTLINTAHCYLMEIKWRDIICLLPASDYPPPAGLLRGGKQVITTEWPQRCDNNRRLTPAPIKPPLMPDSYGDESTLGLTRRRLRILNSFTLFGDDGHASKFDKFAINERAIVEGLAVLTTRESI